MGTRPEEFAALAYVPVIFGGGYLGDQLAKFLRLIGAEAGDYPIEEQDERNDGEAHR